MSLKSTRVLRKAVQRYSSVERTGKIEVYVTRIDREDVPGFVGAMFPVRGKRSARKIAALTDRILRGRTAR